MDANPLVAVIGNRVAARRISSTDRVIHAVKDDDALVTVAEPALSVRGGADEVAKDSDVIRGVADAMPVRRIKRIAEPNPVGIAGDHVP